MDGFDGSAARRAQLTAAVHDLDAVFPDVAERGVVEPYALTYPEDTAREHAADAIYRAWKKRRLEMPLGAFTTATWSAQDAFVRYSVRRLAFFVPRLLADWVEPDGLTTTRWLFELVDEAERRARALALRGEAAAPAPTPAPAQAQAQGWTREELEALARFFAAAMSAALATERKRPEDPMRLVERALQLASTEYSTPSPPRLRLVNVPEEVLTLAARFGVAVDPLVDGLLAEETDIADGYLVEIATAEELPASPPWTDDLLRRLADHLGARFFAATDPAHAKRFSDAEQHLRARIG